MMFVSWLVSLPRRNPNKSRPWEDVLMHMHPFITCSRKNAVYLFLWSCESFSIFGSPVSYLYLRVTGCATCELLSLYWAGGAGAERHGGLGTRSLTGMRFFYMQ